MNVQDETTNIQDWWGLRGAIKKMSQIVEKVNKILIFMIYGTDIGGIYATLGTYMAYI